MNNGSGLLFNWSRLGDCEHTVVAWVDGVESGRVTVQGTTLGVEFVHSATNACEVKNFSHLEQSVLLEWQQNSQSFEIKNME